MSSEQSTPEDSLVALQSLTELDPTDASAFHNLGTALMQLNQYDAAVDSYKKSLELRPHSPDTWHLLGHAYQNEGDRQNAQTAWQETLRLYPGHQEAAQLLNSI